MSSNMGRLIDELIYANPRRGGSLPHVLDLDATVWADSQRAWGTQYAMIHPEVLGGRMLPK